VPKCKILPFLLPFFLFQFITHYLQQDMNAKPLPNEVLLHIFQLVPHQTKYQCMLVRKTWNLAATQEYYDQVSITKENIGLLRPLLRSNNKNVQTILHHGQLVNSLKIIHHTSYPYCDFFFLVINLLYFHVAYLLEKNRFDLFKCLLLYLSCLSYTSHQE
jgi:hypothetical protein